MSSSRTMTITRFCCLIAFMLLSQLHAFCEDPLLCSVGASVVEEMNLQFKANRSIAPVTLKSSVAFLEACPTAIMPSFERFSSDGEDFHRAWIESLKSTSGNGTYTDLDSLLNAAHTSVNGKKDRPLDAFLDGIFVHTATSSKNISLTLDESLERQVVLVLRQFAHCDGAECYDISDFLLFFLGTHPTQFWSAMRSAPDDTTKWLSQLPDESFAGMPSEAHRRKSVRTLLLKRVSMASRPGFEREKSRCISVLNKVTYRAWN